VLSYGNNVRFHQVQALDFSISVNTWTHALEYHLLQQIFNLQVPVDPNATLSRQAVAMAAFFKVAFSSFNGNTYIGGHSTGN
jgi:hypothetical protein